MKISIDPEQCKGHGLCAMVCDTVFDLDDDGYGKVLQGDISDQLLAEVEEAVASCPERAINLAPGPL